jgi:hypothetical protein
MEQQTSTATTTSAVTGRFSNILTPRTEPEYTDDDSDSSEDATEGLEGDSAAEGAQEPDQASGKEPEGEGSKESKEGEGERQVSEEMQAAIRKLAEELDLDPETSRDLLIKLAERENRNLEGQQREESDSSEITPWEKSLAEAKKTEEEAAQTEAKAQEKPPTPSAPAAPEPFRFGDVGDNWKNLADGHRALSDAWDKGDLDLVGKIETALFDRQYMARGLPLALKLADQLVEKKLKTLLDGELGEVRNEAQTRKAARMEREASEFARKELEKTALKDVVQTLFKEDGGKPVMVDGQEYEPIPFNRLAQQYPEILKIREDNSDPAIAQRLTYLARYRAAARIMARLKNEGKVTATEAKALVKAGAESAKRDAASKTRKALNSEGKPPTVQKRDNFAADVLGRVSRGSVAKLLGG